MGDIELGFCYMCNKRNIPISRKYYYYDIQCECCICTYEDKRVHVECINYCADCEPKPPKKVIFEANPINK